MKEPNCKVPLISVIVPIYNAEMFIHKCVNSILSQENVNIECILVDDGSKDNSGLICDKYAQDNNNIVVIHQKNSGTVAARYAGIKIAKGEYIYFVDSDDFILPDALSCMISYMNQDIDIVIFESSNQDSYTPSEYAKALLNFNHWIVWGKLFRKDLFDEYVGNIPRYFKVGEDFLTNLKMLKNLNKTIICVPQHKYIYNINNSQSVQLNHKYNYEYEKQMILEVDSIINQLPWKKEISHSLFNWKMIYLGGMIGLRYQINYKDAWIQSLLEEANAYPLTCKQRIIISATKNIVAQLILIMEKKAKAIGRRLLKK